MRFISSVLFAFTIVFSSCSNSGNTPDVSDIDVDFKLIPFYKDLSEISTDSIKQHLPELKKKYGDYLEAISVKILRIGSPNDTAFTKHLKEFLEYDANRDLFRKIDSLYPDINIFKPDIEKAFKYYKYYFPEKDCPDVYLHISGFNQSIVVDSA